MKKEKIKILPILFIALLTLSLVVSAMSFVSAADSKAIFDPVLDLFKSWNEGNLSVNVAKYLLIALLALLIYSISSILPIIGDRGDWIKWPFALIVAFLSGAYITPNEVYMILISYGALGIVLGTVIPFVIIMFFNLQLIKKSPEHGKMIADVVWIGFIIFLVYKLISGWANDKITLDSIEAIFYFIFIGVSIAWIFWGYKIINKLFIGQLKNMTEERKKDIELEMELQIRALESKLLEAGNDEERSRITRQIEKMKKNQKGLNTISYK